MKTTLTHHYMRAITCTKCRKIHYEDNVLFLAHQIYADDRKIYTRKKYRLTT